MFVLLPLFLIFAGLLFSFASLEEVHAVFLILNSFFMLVATGALFFYAVHILSIVKWHYALYGFVRMLASYIPIGTGIIFVGIIYRYFSFDTLNENGFAGLFYEMNIFTARNALFLILINFLYHRIKLLSDLYVQNLEGSRLNRLKYYSIAYIIVFAFWVSFYSWDWLLTRFEHWHSTIFGWYVFAISFVSAIAFIVALYVSTYRYRTMSLTNQKVLLYLGRYLFAFSVFWAYLWYSQFMLIWYGNIPSETTYFIKQIEYSEFVFYSVLVLCFVLPFLLLLSKRAKHKPLLVSITAIGVLIGHYYELFLIVIGSDKSLSVSPLKAAILFSIYLVFIFSLLLVINEEFLKRFLHKFNFKLN